MNPRRYGGVCGVPSTAKAVSVNITATQPTDAGHLRVYPAGTERPLVSSVKASSAKPGSRFELRIGDLRVYYEVDAARGVVEIRAVGIKDRNRVIIGGEEIVLK